MGFFGVGLVVFFFYLFCPPPHVCVEMGKFRSLRGVFSTSRLNFLSQKINPLPSFCVQILGCLVEE